MKYRRRTDDRGKEGEDKREINIQEGGRLGVGSKGGIGSVKGRG